MTKRIPVIMIVGMLSMLLSGCISGLKKPDTYTNRDGTVTVIENDRETCQRACNEDYARCMDSSAAQDNSGINGPSGVFGASGECREDLQKCLPVCKAE